MSARPTEEDFRPHEGTMFSVHFESRPPVELVLTQVKSFNPETSAELNMERFSLFFQGPGDVMLQQGTYRFVHPEMGELTLFIVPVGRDEQKLAFCRMQYDAQKKEYDARFPDAQYDLILLEGRTAGRFWVGRGEEEIRLLDIIVLPWAQGQGVGTALVRALIEEARASGKRLRHMVFVMNEGARRLYERLGFVVFEEVGGAYLHMEWRGEEKK